MPFWPKNRKSTSYNIPKVHYRPKRSDLGLAINTLNARVVGEKIINWTTPWKKIRPYLRDMIDDDLRTSGTWKIYLTIQINFMSSKDITEKHLMHSKRDNREVLTGKKFESCNKTIALNVLFAENKRQEIK